MSYQENFFPKVNYLKFWVFKIYALIKSRISTKCREKVEEYYLIISG